MAWQIFLRSNINLLLYSGIVPPMIVDKFIDSTSDHYDTFGVSSKPPTLSREARGAGMYVTPIVIQLCSVQVKIRISLSRHNSSVLVYLILLFGTDGEPHVFVQILDG